jgi:hypothetical protein
MALTVTDSGTTAALTSSPTVLATKTTGKTWVLALDLNNMAAGDVFDGAPAVVGVVGALPVRFPERADAASSGPVFSKVPDQAANRDGAHG